ncbi:MAG: LacI family DNA-binding transcriptional regulator, partial [Terriglobia bacterium]
HQEICFVGNLRLPWYARCHAGYERAMNEAGIEARVCSVESMDEQETGYLATKTVLARETKISAIFAGTDPTARGVYKAARDLRLKIPQDLSVVSCNNTYGAWLHPPLTSIREYPEQLGKRMVELALSRIAQPDRPAQQITVPTELIKRESCLPFGGSDGDAGASVQVAASSEAAAL